MGRSWGRRGEVTGKYTRANYFRRATHFPRQFSRGFWRKKRNAKEITRDVTRQTTSPFANSQLLPTKHCPKSFCHLQKISIISFSFSAANAERMCLPNCPFVICGNFVSSRRNAILLHFILVAVQRHRAQHKSKLLQFVNCDMNSHIFCRWQFSGDLGQ